MSKIFYSFPYYKSATNGRWGENLPKYLKQKRLKGGKPTIYIMTSQLK